MGCIKNFGLLISERKTEKCGFGRSESSDRFDRVDRSTRISPNLRCKDEFQVYIGAQNDAIMASHQVDDKDVAKLNTFCGLPSKI